MCVCDKEMPGSLLLAGFPPTMNPICVAVGKHADNSKVRLQLVRFPRSSMSDSTVASRAHTKRELSATLQHSYNADVVVALLGRLVSVSAPRAGPKIELQRLCHRRRRRRQVFDS